jgi:2'-5' RNA ligase/ribosomal protein S18 acetylase RimI-like enzyme
VALVVTGAAASEIDGLRRALGAKALERIAPHLTLVPPVNVSEDAVQAVLEQLRGIAGRTAPISVEFGPPATFWPRTPVLYLKVSGDLAEMAELRDELAVGPLASPPGRKEREFVPHLTLDQRIDPARLPHALVALAEYRRAYCFERVTVLEQGDDHRWTALADAELATPRIAGRGTLDLELAVVERADPPVLAWANEMWAAYSRQRYGDAVRSIEPYAIIARVRGELVGYAEGEVRNPVIRLGRLVVSPDRRGQGAGSHMLRAVERFGLERGCERARLETLANGRAEHFYAEHGYVVTTTLPKWREEQDFVVMERSIVPSSGERPASAT